MDGILPSLSSLCNPAFQINASGRKEHSTIKVGFDFRKLWRELVLKVLAQQAKLSAVPPSYMGPAWSPAAPLSIQILLICQGKQWKISQAHETCNP